MEGLHLPFFYKKFFVKNSQITIKKKAITKLAQKITYLD